MQGFIVNTTKRLLALTALFGVFVAVSSEWSYKHENSWPVKCLTGRKQSPINLQKDTAEHHYFTDFQFKRYDEKFAASETNTGHSIAIKLKDPRPSPSIKGGGLPHEYVLDHLHFHWESEHTVHGSRFPLELHFVHYANIFNATSVAQKMNNGLAVLGVLFDLAEEDNPAFDPLLEELDKVKNITNRPVDLKNSITLSSFLPKDTDTYFRYEGSLTTPTCDEAVIWTVFYQTNYISKKQFAVFQTIGTEEGPLTANYRSLQDLNGRVVTFRNDATSISPKTLQNPI